MTTVEQITLINDLTGLLCTFILLIITGASALIALFAYEAQRKSILITQWTTFKMLLESQEQAIGLLVLKSSPTDIDNETNEEVLKETIRRMQEREKEIQQEMNFIEKKLGLKK